MLVKWNVAILSSPPLPCVLIEFFSFTLLQAQVGKQFILPPYDVVVRSVAKYVRDLADLSDLEVIMEQVFRCPETTKDDFLQRLQRSVEHYKRSNSTSEGNRKILVNTNF